MTVSPKGKRLEAYCLGRGEEPEWLTGLKDDDLVRFHYKEDGTLSFAEVDILYGNARYGLDRSDIHIEGWKRVRIGGWILWSEDDGTLEACSKEEFCDRFELAD